MATAQLSIVIDAQNQAKGVLAGFSRDLKAMQASAKQAGQQMKAMGQSLTKIGGGLTLGVTAPIAGFGAMALKTAADFEQAMANVNAIANGTEKDLQTLTSAAQELGRTTSFSASEAAEGMSFLAMAGFETNEIVAAMPGLLNAAAAGATDLATTSDIVSNVLSGFNIEASDTGRVADILTKTFTSSNTNLTQLGEAMKYAAPVAESLGFSIEDTATAIGFMSDAGIQASMAGTAMRGVLTRLAAPSAKAAEVMKDLGINVFDANGEMLDMPDILRQFQSGLSGLDSAQQTAAIQTIVGTEAMAGFLAVLGRGPDEFEKFSQGLTDSTGTASDVASKQLDTMQGQMKLLKSALEGLQIAVAEPLLPVITSMVQTITPAVGRLAEAFANLSPTAQRVTLVIGGIAAALGPVIAGIGLTMSAISGLMPLISAMGPALSAAGGAIAALSGPIGWAIGAVALLGLAWSTNFLGIRDITAQAWEAVKPMLAEWGAKAQQLLAHVVGSGAKIKEAWGEFATVFANVQAKLEEGWLTLKETVTIAIENFSWSDFITQFVWPWVTWTGWSTWIASFVWPVVSWDGWTTFINDFAWPVITWPGWGAFVTALLWPAMPWLGWGVYITKLVWPSMTWDGWSSFFTGATMPTITWDGWSSFVDDFVWPAVTWDGWSSWVSPLVWPAMAWDSWSTFISDLDWPSVAFDGWSTWISDLDWPDLAFDGWDTWIADLAWPAMDFDGWDTWISDLRWPSMAFDGWSTWITSLSWPSMTFPGWSTWITSLAWPSLTFDGWSEFIPSFKWPSIPAFPGWASIMSTLNPFGSRGSAPTNAIGTSNWRGGMTWVGETGPELVALPRGSRIFSNSESQQMVAAGNSGPAVVIQNVTVANGVDVEALAYRVASAVQRRRR